MAATMAGSTSAPALEAALAAEEAIDQQERVLLARGRSLGEAEASGALVVARPSPDLATTHAKNRELAFAPFEHGLSDGQLGRVDGRYRQGKSP